MTEYRITKYNPSNRIDDVYIAEEWTSFHDIGKTFGGKILSQDVYLKTEQAYVDCCVKLIEEAKVSKLYIKQAEYYAENVRFPSSITNTQEIRQIITACLREQCWLKLASKDFFIHFGYDYYMYIGSMLPSNRVTEIVAQHGLYCEQYTSPYSC